VLLDEGTSSRSAAFTHAASEPYAMPNDFATSARDRSDERYDATASRRNSSGHSLGLLGAFDRRRGTWYPLGKASGAFASARFHSTRSAGWSTRAAATGWASARSWSRRSVALPSGISSATRRSHNLYMRCRLLQAQSIRRPRSGDRRRSSTSQATIEKAATGSSGNASGGTQGNSASSPLGVESAGSQVTRRRFTRLSRVTRPSLRSHAHGVD
jgi:hypothetical protein